MLRIAAAKLLSLLHQLFINKTSVNESMISATSRLCAGWHSPGKPGKVTGFKSGQGKCVLHARNVANCFSGKSLKFLLPDVRF